MSMDQAGTNQTQEECAMEETTTAIAAVKQEVRIRDWAAQIEAQQASGMTVPKMVRREWYQSKDLLLSSAEAA